MVQKLLVGAAFVVMLIAFGVVTQKQSATARVQADLISELRGTLADQMSRADRAESNTGIALSRQKHLIGELADCQAQLPKAVPVKARRPYWYERRFDK